MGEIIMKEIIYLDTEIINSMLAQLDEGIVNSFVMESSSQETQGEETQSTFGKDASMSARLKLSTGILPGGSVTFGGNSGEKGVESEKISSTILEGQKDILNKAFHDYSLEILINKLYENGLLNSGNLKEGDLLLTESSFRYYDFELLKNSMNPDVAKKIMTIDIEQIPLTLAEANKIVNKTNPTAKDRDKMADAQKVVDTHEQVAPIIALYEQLSTLGQYASEMLPSQSVIKADSYIGITKSKFLKESPEALVFRTDNTRKAKILFRVIGRKNNVFNGFNLGNFSEQDIDKLPNLMLDIILGSFGIIKKGDTLVTPIAIYFE